MAIESATYTYADTERWVTAVDNGVAWEMVDLDSDLQLARAVHRWVEDGNEIEPNEDGRKRGGSP